MEELECLVLTRDQQIELIMDQYGEEIKRLAYTYVKDHSTAEDITQEIFISVYLKLNSFAGRSSVKTWIYSIAINKCKDHLRSWHVRKISVQENIKEFLRTNRHGPDHETIDKMDSEQIVDQVLQLSIKYREVILFYYYKNLSIKEVSAILGISDSTVKVRLHRGREKLKKPLEFLGRGEANG